MKAVKYLFLSLNLFSSIFFAQPSFAGYLKYHYQSSVMMACCEHTVDQKSGLPSELFLNAEEQLSLYFISPDLSSDLQEGEVAAKTIENPQVVITGSNYFLNPTTYNSHFWVESEMLDGFISQRWELTFDIIDDRFPSDLVRRASVRLGSSDVMTFQQENYYYKRCGPYPPEWQMGCSSGVYDSTVEFYSFYEGSDLPLDQYRGGIYRLHGEPLSVTEPFTYMLLVTGLAGLFFSRRNKLK